MWISALHKWGIGNFNPTNTWHWWVLSTGSAKTNDDVPQMCSSGTKHVKGDWSEEKVKPQQEQLDAHNTTWGNVSTGKNSGQNQFISEESCFCCWTKKRKNNRRASVWSFSVDGGETSLSLSVLLWTWLELMCQFLVENALSPIKRWNFTLKTVF